MPPAAKRAVTLLLIPLLCCGALLFFCVRNPYTLFLGRYLQGNSGSHILVCQDGMPIVMRDCSRDDALFAGLSDGDRVLVLHSGIAESYPGQSGAYFCLRLGGGAPSDLPADTLEQLTQLGWLSASI